MEVLYPVVKTALKPFITRGLKWTVEGGHMIPRHGPAILAANHSGYLDPLGLAYLADLQRRRVRFLTKRELFEKRFYGRAFHWLRQIPVDRGTGDAVNALQAAVDALGRGEVVAIFPEGTISLDLDPMPGKTGTARLAQLSGVPVTPVGMWGSHRVLFKGRKPKWKWGVAHVGCVGPPVRVEPDEDVFEATDRVMAAICTEVARARELYPQRPDPGEDDWWVRAPESAVLRTCRREEPPPEAAASETA